MKSEYKYSNLCWSGALILFCTHLTYAQKMDSTSAPDKRGAVSTFFEIERVSGREERPFTQVAFVLNREIQRAPKYSLQLVVDGWAGGDEPYFAIRLEGCRRFSGLKHKAEYCTGLGVYQEERGQSPVGSFSTQADLWDGRVSYYVSVERAFMAPTFTYYHADAMVTVGEWRGEKISAGIVSRSVQHAAGKVAIDFNAHFQGYVSAGSGRATAGIALRF